ncbi:MAG: acetyl-CoA carboxylase biotin carboxyl carrier protein subunit [Oligoflexia bacterium]|nr:acetyl-CoA carboxylase biotin carboxyl carrier protein subunit [Oligoflexia bacterium]
MAITKYLRQGSKLWVHHSGRTFVVEAEGSATGLITKPHKKKTLSGVLESPMPGKILKINVKKGEVVKENQTLCVIEAMKMEYALKAPFDGKIKEVFKTPNQLVVLSEKVLEMEKQ